MTDRNWRILVHGGAGSAQIAHGGRAHEERARAGLTAALAAGSTILRTGGSSVDAVEAAARILEDDFCFNAGRGSVLTSAGEIELDASIMDGRTRRAGAVAGLKTTRAPISLARHLMDHGPHVFLSGDGADHFAAAAGLDQVANEYFMTAERQAQLAEALESDEFDPIKYGTIGAVAVDSAGHVAAATSTGGITAKQWGRIGDSPLIGAGTYADDRSVAVSATGAGEYFIRSVAAHELAVRMRIASEPLQPALDSVLADIQSLGGRGGLIAVAPNGDHAWGFTTPAMYRGAAGPDGLRVAIYAEDESPRR